MTEAFVRIVNMSISASWIVLVVLILRVLLQKAPKWIRLMLWGIVAFRLICPVSIESIMSLLPSAETIDPQILTEPFVGIYSGIDLVDNAVNPVIRDAYSVTDVEKSGQTFVLGVKLCSRLWVQGMILLSVYTAVSYGWLRHKVATAVRCARGIYQNEYVKSPFVLGILRPRIYIPYGMDPQQLLHVLSHEQAHIRRGDHWWKPLGYVLLILHWFNPLMWVAYKMFCRDLELACDEKVIRELNSRQRADYMQALLSCSVRHHSMAVCPLAFGEVGVKDRVESVMNYQKPGFWILFLAVIACLGVAVCFLTNPKRDSFTIRIVVPAGSEELFVYSDEEISPLKNYVIISSGQGLGDTEVILKPIYVEYENVYEPAVYMTPGIPVKLFAEKGGWFKIGINMQNPTDQDKEVFVEVKYVEVRIEDSMEPYQEKETMLSGENTTEWIEAYREYVSTVDEKYRDKIHIITVQNYTAQEINRGEGRPLVDMTEEDARTLLQIIEEGTEKYEGTTDCLRDCAININGRLFYYHSSCGTFYEPDLGVMSTYSSVEVGNPGMSYHLTETQRAEVNEILKRYIMLEN